MLFLKAERDGKMIFPNNYFRAVELFQTKRSDLIGWKEFIQLIREVPYLSFPAFRLQKSLRVYTLGESVWDKVENRLLNRKETVEQKNSEIKVQNDELKQKVWGMQMAVEDYDFDVARPSLREFSKREKKKASSVVSV